MEKSVKYQFLMSQLTHMRDIKDTEKTKLSLVYYEQLQSTCVLRVCKNRDLSAVCEALRKIRNPNAVVVYDYVYESGDTYILEESISGASLQERIDHTGIFSETDTARIIVQVCKALEALHSEEPPVVHNDINPSNIMLREDGSVKLFDFDISRLYKKGANQNTVLFGTEEYASPEHYGYGQSEPRTDIYCLGVTMHKMLTGEGLSNEHRITYNGKLKPILEKCLQFDPKDRYAAVRALRKDLEQFLSGKRKLFVWAFAGAAAIILLLLGGFILKQGASFSQPEEMHPALRETEAIRTTQKQDEEPEETTVPGEAEGTTSPTSREEMQNTTPPTATPTAPNQPPNENLTQPDRNDAPADTTLPQTDKNQETPVAPPQNEEPSVKNDTWETAGKIVLFDEFGDNNWNTWTIEKEGEPDWWKFTTCGEKSVYAVVVDCSVANPVNGQTVACLYDSEGNELKTLTVNYKEKERFMDVVLEPSKEYYIKVAGVNAEAPALGDYRLGIVELGYGREAPYSVALTLDTLCASSDRPGYIEELYTFWVTKTGKYKIEICNLEDYAIHIDGVCGIKEWIEAGETVSFTFNALQGRLVDFTLLSRNPDAGMSDPIGAYTLLVTYEGEVLNWSEMY